MPEPLIPLANRLAIPPAIGSLTFLSAPAGNTLRPWIFRALAHSLATLGAPSVSGAAPATSGGGDINIYLPGSEGYLIGLNQDWHGKDLLRVTQAQTPTAFTLFVYAATDWENNRRDPSQAIGSSALDAGGRWLQTIEVTPGKYHVVLLNATEAKMIFPYLDVEPASG